MGRPFRAETAEGGADDDSVELAAARLHESVDLHDLDAFSRLSEAPASRRRANGRTAAATRGRARRGVSSGERSVARTSKRSNSVSARARSPRSAHQRTAQSSLRRRGIVSQSDEEYVLDADEEDSDTYVASASRKLGAPSRSRSPVGLGGKAKVKQPALKQPGETDAVTEIAGVRVPGRPYGGGLSRTRVDRERSVEFYHRAIGEYHVSGGDLLAHTPSDAELILEAQAAVKAESGLVRFGGADAPTSGVIDCRRGTIQLTKHSGGGGGGGTGKKRARPPKPSTLVGRTRVPGAPAPPRVPELPPLTAEEREQSTAFFRRAIQEYGVSQSALQVLQGGEDVLLIKASVDGTPTKRAPGGRPVANGGPLNGRATKRRRVAGENVEVAAHVDEDDVVVSSTRAPRPGRQTAQQRRGASARAIRTAAANGTSKKRSSTSRGGGRNGRAKKRKRAAAQAEAEQHVEVAHHSDADDDVIVSPAKKRAMLASDTRLRETREKVVSAAAAGVAEALGGGGGDDDDDAKSSSTRGSAGSLDEEYEEFDGEDDAEDGPYHGPMPTAPPKSRPKRTIRVAKKWDPSAETRPARKGSPKRRGKKRKKAENRKIVKSSTKKVPRVEVTPITTIVRYRFSDIDFEDRDAAAAAAAASKNAAASPKRQSPRRKQTKAAKRRKKAAAKTSSPAKKGPLPMASVTKRTILRGGTPTREESHNYVNVKKLPTIIPGPHLVEPVEEKHGEGAGGNGWCALPLGGKSPKMPNDRFLPSTFIAISIGLPDDDVRKPADIEGGKQRDRRVSFDYKATYFEMPARQSASGRVLKRAS